MKFEILQIISSVEESNTVSLFELVSKGGVIMIPIVLLSVISTYLFIERLLYIKRASLLDDQIIQFVTRQLLKGDKEVALEYCRRAKFPFANMVEKAILRIGSPIHNIESVLRNMADVEIAKMERNMSVLSAIATIAPMLGFLGTVFGMITTFHDISLQEDLSIGVIANGIYQKMITSAAGLIVGICSYAYYMYLQNMIEQATVTLEINSIYFMDSFFKPMNNENQTK